MDMSYQAIASPYAAAGVLEGNPIHEDMVCAARSVIVRIERICRTAIIYC